MLIGPFHSFRCRASRAQEAPAPPLVGRLLEPPRARGRPILIADEFIYGEIARVSREARSSS